MVDIIGISDTVGHVKHIVHGCHDIVYYNMFGNKLIMAKSTLFLYLLVIFTGVEYLAQHVEAHTLIDAALMRVKIYKMFHFDHAV